MEEPKLDVALHAKYFQRYLKSLLPTQYTGNDSTRVALACFILSGLDLLNHGPSTFPPSSRLEYKNWFLSCQHPHGGFCGSPNQKFPDSLISSSSSRDDGNSPWLDGAQLQSTYFAILGLSFLDGLEEVRRLECLNWLRRMQRDDGSFGEVLGVGGRVEGGRDMRYCYCAVAVRWMLMREGEVLENDIDVEKLVVHLRAGETYDGGISESASHEAHAGYAYCALAALSMLGRLPSSTESKETSSAGKDPGLTNINSTIRWLMARQNAYIAIDGDDGDDESDDQEVPDHESPEEPLQEKPINGNQNDDIPSLKPITIDECYYVGHNGRCNKPADTCYSFWTGASLDLLGQSKLINREPIRRFLLEQTQHQVLGGFAKSPSNPPDIYHSFLGLAALATMKDPALKELDTALCVSVEAKKKIEAFKRKKDEKPEFRIFDLLAEMARTRTKGNEGEELEREKERLVTAARNLKVGNE